MAYDQYNTSSGYISIRTGSEGPLHDPYGFTEYKVVRRGHRTAILHLGLVVWSKITGRPDAKRIDEKAAVSRFEKACGWTKAEIDLAIARCEARDYRKFGKEIVEIVKQHYSV